MKKEVALLSFEPKCGKKSQRMNGISVCGEDPAQADPST